MSELDALLLPPKLPESVLITHRDCLDGSVSAILWKAMGAGPVRFVPAGGLDAWHRKDPDGDVSSGRFLVVCDLAPRFSKCADALEKRGNAVLLDHHATARDLAERRWCHVDMDACGAELLRCYLAGLPSEWGGTMRETCWGTLADWADAHDRWRFPMPKEATDLQDLMNVYGQERFVEAMRNWRMRMDPPFWGSPHGFMTDEEAFAVRLEQERRDERHAAILKKARVREMPWGRTAYLVSSEPCISILLQRALAELPGAQVVCLVNVERGTVAMRSLPGGVDVSAVASQFGGGGHVVAAGHSLSQDILDGLVDGVHG